MDNLLVRKKGQLKEIWLENLWENQMDNLLVRKKGRLKEIWLEKL